MPKPRALASFQKCCCGQEAHWRTKVRYLVENRVIHAETSDLRIALTWVSFSMRPHEENSRPRSPPGVFFVQKSPVGVTYSDPPSFLLNCLSSMVQVNQQCRAAQSQVSCHVVPTVRLQFVSILAVENISEIFSRTTLVCIGDCILCLTL